MIFCSMRREQKQESYNVSEQRKQASSRCRGSMSAVAGTLDVCPSYPAPPPDDEASLGTVRVSTPHVLLKSGAWPGQSFLGGHTVPSMAEGPSSVCGSGLPALSWTCCVHKPPSQLSCEPYPLCGE